MEKSKKIPLRTWILIIILLILFSAYILFKMPNQKTKDIEYQKEKGIEKGIVKYDDFNYFIQKNDKLDFVVDYNVFFYGNYKSPGIEEFAGTVTVYHEKFGKIDSSRINVIGGFFPKFLIWFDEGVWHYDLQQVIEENYEDFEINCIGNKTLLNEEITYCFSLKGKLDNMNVDLENCYNSYGITLYQKVSDERGSAEFIATSYELIVD